MVVGRGAEYGRLALHPLLDHHLLLFVHIAGYRFSVVLLCWAAEPGETGATFVQAIAPHDDDALRTGEDLVFSQTLGKVGDEQPPSAHMSLDFQWYVLPLSTSGET